MEYCTLDDIRKVIDAEIVKQLTDDERLDQINLARVQEAIAQADAEIDTWIGGRYPVPLSSVPTIIRKCSCSIAIMVLYRRRPMTVPGDVITDAYDDALHILKSLSRGEAALSLSDGSAPEADVSIGVVETSHFEAVDA